MKYLISCILAALTIGLSFRPVSAQTDTAHFWIGTPDGTDYAVGVGIWNDFPKYFMGGPDVWIGDIYRVLGVRKDIIDLFDLNLCQYHWPFTGGTNGWSVKEFGDYNDDTSAYPNPPGDANMYNGIWPPEVIGSNVTYLVKYFRGAAEPCLLDGFYGAADVNGDCRVVGSDVTRMVSYFRGVAELAWCPDYPPAWPVAQDIPETRPDGWPECN